VASAPSVAVAMPSPTGQLVSMTPIAVDISRAANQSATILASRMFMSTAPTPLSRRPPAATTKPCAPAVTRPPATMSPRLTTTMRRSPKR
jgi:hypothetical protein